MTNTKQKPWILNAFAMFSPSHLSPGLWKHPQDRAGDFTDLSYWTELATVLEKGKFHGLFLADHLGVYDVYKGPGNSKPARNSPSEIPCKHPAATRGNSSHPQSAHLRHGGGNYLSVLRHHRVHHLRSLAVCPGEEILPWITSPVVGVYSDATGVRAMEHRGRYFQSTAMNQVP